MTQFIEIHWTSDSLDEARKVSRYLVQERLVACAQITPWIESIYLWDGKLEVSQESKIVLKTMKELFEPIKKIITENCHYEVPEIIAVPILQGNEQYLNWIQESLCSYKDSE